MLIEYLMVISISCCLSWIFIEFFKNKLKIFGKDMHKNGNIILPEAIGISTGLSFIVTLFIYLIKIKMDEPIIPSTFNYYIAVTSSCMFTILLGFLDDLLNLEWKYKIIFPAFSNIPCILLYDGGTTVIVPFLGLKNIGYFYYIYMIAFSIFSTNSINILSGINGLEVLQILIISGVLFIDNIIQHFRIYDPVFNVNNSIHYFGSVICLVLFFSSIPLYYYNKFPAKVFVGDTYCYFAGMSLSCVAILCHTTRTLFSLFLIQMINFIISMPQICGFIPCPRHRMPGFDGKYIIPSFVKFKNKKICNLTVLNLILKCFGKMKEDELCWVVGYFMIFWCLVVLFVKNTILYK